MTIRTLIVDDEPLARERIRNILLHYPEFEIVGECSDGYEAIRTVRQERPDLMFLDVEMQEMDGVSLLRILDAERPPAIIFVTGHEDYALEAFEAHAVDYLLKPFDKVRFIRALDKVKARLRQPEPPQKKRAQAETDQNSASGALGKYITRFMIKKDGRVSFVKVSDIDWIESSGNYLRLHAGDRAHLVRDTMTGMEAKLDPAVFMRIHRGVIVCIERVRELTPSVHGEYEVALADGTRLTMSRGDKDRLVEVIGRRK